MSNGKQQLDSSGTAPSLITVAIPTYNGERYIADTIASVRTQSHQALEIVVVDDGSTDSTRDIVKAIALEDPRIRLVAQPNGGIAVARNRCVAESSPDAAFFMLLDHDDLLEPQAVELLRDALIRRPDCVAAHGMTTVVDSGNNEVPLDAEMIRQLGLRRRRLRQYSIRGAFQTSVVCDDSEDTTFGTLLYKNCITSMGAVLFRHSALCAAGPFRQDLAPVDDWDMYLRASLLGSFCYVPSRVLRWRKHGSNTSLNEYLMGRSYHRLMLDIAQTDFPPNFRAQVSAVLVYRVVAMTYLVFKGPKSRTNRKLEAFMAMKAALKYFLRRRAT
jgi:glycosyltransferase involved in cell wall biosynthesis